MTWTYQNSPSTNSSQGRRDAVRQMINDVSSARELKSDEAIAFALAQWNNSVYHGAAFLCDQLADSEAVATRVGDLSLGAEKPANYKALASRYRMLASLRGAVPFAVAMSSAAKNTYRTDTDRVQPAFTRGMMTRPGTVAGTTSS